MIAIGYSPLRGERAQTGIAAGRPPQLPALALHADMRHRLDKDGKRYGRQIPWHASELRVIELLEGMCDAVAEAHELHAVVAGAEHEWVRSDGLPADRVVDRHRRKEERKQLGVFCHSLVEEKEDRLNGALQSKAGIDVNQLEALLCDRHCKSSANNQNAEL